MVIRGEQNTVLVTMELSVCHCLSVNPRLLYNASFTLAGPSVLSADICSRKRDHVDWLSSQIFSLCCHPNKAGVSLISYFTAYLSVSFLVGIFILLRIRSKKFYFPILCSLLVLMTIFFSCLIYMSLFFIIFWPKVLLKI